MCGIIGYMPIDPAPEISGAFRRLFDESRVRGTHAYGITSSFGGELETLRSFNWEDIPKVFNPAYPTIAHCRYCQSGDWRVLENNQPIVVDQTAVAMNGVIHMGTKEEYEAAFDVKCQVDNDSEIFLQRLKGGQDAESFIKSISGSFAAVWIEKGKIHAARNARRPLYSMEIYGACWWASTADIFKRAGFNGVPYILSPGLVDSL